jgi:hypothetical protein
MAVHDAYARLSPYELSFPDLGFARTHFEAIRREAEERRVDLRDPQAFVLLASSGQALREIRGPQDDPALIRQYGYLLYHTYHFCGAGEPLYLLPASGLRRLVERVGPAMGWMPALEPAAAYVQLPQHLVWVRASDDAPPESLDGFFWVRTSERSFGLLFALGMRGDRPGLSVVPLGDLPIAEAGEWLTMDMRGAAGDGDFRSSLPGAELDGLLELRATGEAIKLAALVLRGLETGTLGRARLPAPSKPGQAAPAPRPSGLRYRKLRIR